MDFITGIIITTGYWPGSSVREFQGMNLSLSLFYYYYF